MRIEGNKKKGLISKKFWFYITWDVRFILLNLNAKIIFNQMDKYLTAI